MSSMKRVSAAAIALWVAGCVGTVLLAAAIISLIGAAWNECADLSAGARFALVALQMPAALIAIGSAFAATAFVMRRQPVIVTTLVASVAMIAAAMLVVALSVPVGGDHNWVGLTSEDLAGIPGSCRPDGVPTWWPNWLPS
jgi:hypothetical protein